jgi:hypothetical protein
MSRDDSHIWRNAVQTEIDTLKARETWELFPRSPRTRVLPSKMVLKIKRQPNGDVDRYKKRLVALGCLHREGDHDETFSPLVDFTMVRFALALAIHERTHVHHVDVTGAFLYGDLEEELYMSLPPGFEDSEHPDYVCKLKKTLYGLKQSPRIWHQHLCSYLASLRL